LREVFALVEAADAVVCNASMLMHVAAAFEKRTVVTLGADYPSASREGRLWNCNPRALLLGREIGSSRGLGTPDEVFQFVSREA
jgi:heptosyltransferase-2